MPFYEYECTQCRYFAEVLQKLSDAPLRKCPSCGRNTFRKLVSAPVFRLKGSGWYETDFKGEREAKRNLAAADAEDSKAAGSAEKPATGEVKGEAQGGAAKGETQGAAQGAAQGGAPKGEAAAGKAAGAGTSESRGAAAAHGTGASSAEPARSTRRRRTSISTQSARRAVRRPGKSRGRR